MEEFIESLNELIAKIPEKELKFFQVRLKRNFNLSSSLGFCVNCRYDFTRQFKFVCQEVEDLLKFLEINGLKNDAQKWNALAMAVEVELKAPQKK